MLLDTSGLLALLFRSEPQYAAATTLYLGSQTRLTHSMVVAELIALAHKSYSLCDAISFALMRDNDITEAHTTDHHFEQEGFVRLLAL